MGIKDPLYEKHLKVLSMDRPKEFRVIGNSTEEYVARWCRENGLRHYKTPEGKKVPKCKRCGAPCVYYGPVGGFSVKCKACNDLHNKKARERRKRNKA